MLLGEGGSGNLETEAALPFGIFQQPKSAVPDSAAVEMGKPRAPPKSNRGGSDADLHAAARTGDLRAVESICISNPLAVNSRDRHSRTPLHLAAWSGQTEVVSYLCKHKADVGAAAMDDTGAIHFASQKGHLEVVRLLLSSGISVKAANRKGLTPLHYAVQGSHLELIKYLVRKGANLSAKTKAGQTPLDLANSEEVRSFVVECEQSLKKADESTKSKKVGESVSVQPDKEYNKDSDAEDLSNEAEKAGDTREKREIEDTSEENSSKAKKARVSLEHLMAENDVEDGEEE